MEGPFRRSEPTDRRVVSRSEPSVSRAPDPEPRTEQPQQYVTQEQKPVHRAPMPHISAKDKKPFKRFILPLLALIVIILLVVGGWALWSKSQNAGTAIDGSKYQAVFFTNGQVYFGKLHAFNDESMKLTDIWYLQASTADSKNPQQTSTDSSNVQLIKLGNEIHGPEDQMVLSKNQLLFYENLKSDSKVVKAIEAQKAK